jgi:hypothetical protein
MPDVDISIEVTGAEEWAEYLQSREVAQSVEVKLGEVLLDMVEYARSIAPKRTGAYSESIFAEKVGDLKFIFGSRSPYAAPIEFGSMAHFILPRRGKALRFETDGEVVFARYVMHPGTAPQQIIHRTKKDFQSRIYEAIRGGVREAMKK